MSSSTLCKVIHLNLFATPVTVLICILNEINCSDLKSLLPTLNCALINPKFICSYDQLTTALTRTVNNHLAGTMKTRSPYTELLYSLSPSTNVTESLKTFGVDESASSAIALRIIQASEADASLFIEELKSALNCQISDFSIDAVSQQCDLEAIKALYKPTNPSRMIGEICTSIATKNI